MDKPSYIWMLQVSFYDPNNGSRLVRNIKAYTDFNKALNAKHRLERTTGDKDKHDRWIQYYIEITEIED